MKIATITRVRDEADIIELFVRLNSRVVDHMYIVDNESVDATVEILKRLAKEGLPISLSSYKDNNFKQAEFMTMLLHDVHALGIYDWIMPLDADEFLDESKESLLTKLEATPKQYIPKSQWRTWVPRSMDYASHDAPLYNNFNPLYRENTQGFKIALEKSKIPGLKIETGSHYARNIKTDAVLDSHNCGVRINHFPVRSVEQISAKALLGFYRWPKTPPKPGPTNPGNLYHWPNIVRNLREVKFRVDLPLFRFFAYAYSTRLEPPVDPQVDTTIPGIGFGSPDDVIVHRDLAKINLPAILDSTMLIMHDEICHWKGKVT
jgi:glycosyltransferase involved in cell wall biosynthesis